jgi:hypothetical protein
VLEVPAEVGFDAEMGGQGPESKGLRWMNHVTRLARRSIHWKQIEMEGA